MPKNEEIQEKNNKVNKEKISKKAATLEKTKTEKDATKKSYNKNTQTKDVAKNETIKKYPVKTIKKESKAAVKKSKEKKKVNKEPKTFNVKESEVKTKNIEAEENKVDELSVIEKIKSFIAKIAAMQEEARKEAQIESEDEENKVTKKSKTIKKEKSKDEKEVKKFEYMLEYYDLPYRYNETVVKILAQTPKKIFVYWDISDNDREKYIRTFGEDFFNKTYPVLLLYNEDKKYIKEIAINDFANSWYIDIPDAKTKYSIQLGRKFKTHNEVVKVNMQKVQENNIILHTDYLPFANSNILEVPNDHVLLESLPKFILFRNVKTNEETVKELKNIENVYGNNYDVKDFYEEHYKDELSEGMFDMANPSSSLSSSSFK